MLKSHMELNEKHKKKKCKQRVKMTVKKKDKNEKLEKTKVVDEKWQMQWNSIIKSKHYYYSCHFILNDNDNLFNLKGLKWESVFITLIIAFIVMNRHLYWIFWKWQNFFPFFLYHFISHYNTYICQIKKKLKLTVVDVVTIQGSPIILNVSCW